MIRDQLNTYFENNEPSLENFVEILDIIYEDYFDLIDIKGSSFYIVENYIMSLESEKNFPFEEWIKIIDQKNRIEFGSPIYIKMQKYIRDKLKNNEYYTDYHYLLHFKPLD